MRNSNNSYDFIASGKVTSLAMPFKAAPGFAVPLIRSRGDGNAMYVQRVDRARNIVGFDMFEGEARIIPLKQEQLARVGNKEVFALIDPQGEAHAGTQKELSPMVRDWVSRIDEPLLRMTFARFCGEDDIAKASAREVIRKKSAEFKSRESAIVWFLNSVVLVELVDTLAATSNARSPVTRDAISEGGLVFANITNRRLDIELPVSLLNPGRKRNIQQSGRLQKIIEFLRFATDMDVDLKRRSMVKGDSSARNNVELGELENELRRLPRQESRLSLLIKLMFENPEIGGRLLQSSLDNTAFLKMALSKLRSSVDLDRSDRVDQVAHILPSIISAAYPRQRGLLLLELSRALSEHPMINALIRKAALGSNSMDMLSLRSEILENLS